MSLPLTHPATPRRSTAAEIIIDAFAGGGGASTGIEQALGRSPEIAINHDEAALTMHARNHSETLHLPENIWKVNIDQHTGGRPVGLLWASPDCRHFSKARGGKPTSRSVRMLAWSIVKFVKQLGPNKPRVIIMENVEEFKTWEDFPAWSSELRRAHGYRIEHRELVAADYGAPTIRKRLFIVMRCDGQPIVWPKPTHARNGADGLKPWRSAAEIIDWSIPCPSIFDTSEEIMAKHGLRAVRPLSDNTLRRIAAGVQRYVLDAEQPFFVTYAQHGGRNRDPRDPVHTICANHKDQNAIVVPTLATMGYGEREGQEPRVPGVKVPLRTIVSGGNKFGLIAAFLAQHNTERNGVNPGREARDPLSTVTVRGTQQNVAAVHLMNMKGTARSSRDAVEPLTAVCAGGLHAALVSAFMVKYYGAGVGQTIRDPLHTVTTKERHGLVTLSIDGTTYAIVDIGLRMLTPRELYRAQGFPESYIIDGLTKTQQIAKCGNSVCPPLSKALARANCNDLARDRMAA